MYKVTISAGDGLTADSNNLNIDLYSGNPEFTFSTNPNTVSNWEDTQPCIKVGKVIRSFIAADSYYLIT